MKRILTPTIKATLVQQISMRPITQQTRSGQALPSRQVPLLVANLDPILGNYFVGTAINLVID